jgi:hypothetical protein
MLYSGFVYALPFFGILPTPTQAISSDVQSGLQTKRAVEPTESPTLVLATFAVGSMPAMSCVIDLALGLSASRLATLGWLVVSTDEVKVLTFRTRGLKDWAAGVQGLGFVLANALRGSNSHPLPGSISDSA